MNPQDIPDDVWIEIFDDVAESATLAALMRTCKRFYELAHKPLLRNLYWRHNQSTSENIDAWNRTYRECRGLVRTISMSIPFDFTLPNGLEFMTPEKRLFDRFHAELPHFINLHSLTLDGTVICPYTYRVVAQAPSLRKLEIHNCKFFPYELSFSEYHARPLYGQQTPIPPFALDQLRITHLSIHKITCAHDHEFHHQHPFMLSSVPTLEHLSMTWSTSQSMIYSPVRWTLPQLRSLDVTLPHLQRDLVDTLVAFVNQCPNEPRISLSIERHSLSDQQINSLSVPLRGVWSYKGPLPIASFSSTRKIDRDSPGATLQHVIMNEAMDLNSLVDGLEVLPRNLQTLEIQVRMWDMELLFAVRCLFPEIRSITIRFGKGFLPPTFLETLGSNILFDLTNLHTFRILYDEGCTVTTRQLAGFHHGFLFAAPMGHLNMDTDEEIDEDHVEEREESPPRMEHHELKDYLLGWNRYCKSLRCVQLHESACWVRRFEGDAWTAKPSPSVSQIPLPVPT